MFNSQKPVNIEFRQHPFKFILEDVENLVSDERQLKNYQIQNIYLIGDYLKAHFTYKDRSEGDYSSYYQNYLIKMKASINDHEFIPLEDDENYIFTSKDGEPL